MRRAVPSLCLLAVLAVAAACGELAPSTAPQLAARADLAAAGEGRLLECPSDFVSATTGLVDVGGGAVGLGRASVHVPNGAVPSAVLIDVHVPASPYVEVELHANGAEHYTFRKPVTVTIDYSRCGDAVPEGAVLRAVYIDPATKQVLEDMGGTMDAVARTVTFSTGHFSSYALSY